MTVSPELLAAYADGELDASAARSVEAAIARDPELQAKLAAHRALRARLAAHFAPVAEQPVPLRLQRAVLGEGAGAEVVDLGARLRKRDAGLSRARWTRFVGPALAATVVLTVVGLGMRSSGDYARGAIADALDHQLVATQRPDAPVRMLLSFRDASGQYCRGFAGRSQSGIACRDDRGWRLQRTFGGVGDESGEYRQAGSSAAEVMAAMQDMAAGPALDAEGEEKAARAGWRTRKGS